MKIGYLSPGWPHENFPNGIVKYLDTITKELDRQGHDCFVFSSNIYEKSKYPNVVDLSETRDHFKSSGVNKIIQKISNKLGLKNFSEKDESFVNNFAFDMRKLERKDSRDFDILEMEESFGWAEDVVNKINVPVIVKLHGPWFLNGAALGVKKNKAFFKRIEAEGRGICAAAGIASPSKCVLEKVREYYGIELPNAQVLPNPIVNVCEEKKWTFSSCKKNQILFIGRFDKLKGGDIVINAFNLVAKKNKQAKLVFAGPDRGVKDGGHSMTIKEYIDRTIKDTGIKDRIRYLGQISSSEANQLRKESHVTIMASRWENFANTVTEALAVGCPTVGTESGGTPEIIKNNETGLLVKVDDSIDLAEKISLVLGDSKLAIKLSKNAATDVEKRFGSRRIAIETLNYYGDIIKNTNGNGNGNGNIAV